jgi:glucokinase
MNIVVGDLGGTKTELVHYERRGPSWALRRSERYASQEFDSFEEILAHFAAGSVEPVDAAVFAVAGPVRAGRASLTNVRWALDERTLSETLAGARVTLMNDLEALTWGVFRAEPAQLIVLRNGVRVGGAPIAVMAPGTGLGKAYGAEIHGYRAVFPTEGGHVELAPRNDAEDAFARFLRERFGRASLEHAVSGPGLVLAHEHVESLGKVRSADALRARFTHEDRAFVISDAAMKRTDAACEAALDLFVGLLGSALGDYALDVMPRGGLYLGGGIPPKILPRLKEPLFTEAFLSKAPMRALLEELFVAVVVDARLALHGALSVALESRR